MAPMVDSVTIASTMYHYYIELTIAAMVKSFTHFML
jgi:hypothetical protein